MMQERETDHLVTEVHQVVPPLIIPVMATLAHSDTGKESGQGCTPKRLLGRPDEALGGGNQATQ